MQPDGNLVSLPALEKVDCHHIRKIWIVNNLFLARIGLGCVFWKSFAIVSTDGMCYSMHK